jgi:hypothetical protein
MTNEAPRRFISNSLVHAEVYLPDAKNGFYRGTRFEWAGVVGSLTCGGHQYFGVWYEDHDPLKHDCITGPAEEFQGETEPDIDYPLVDVGASFLRLGIGFLRKIDSDGFQRFRTYPFVAQGQWHVCGGPDRIDFQHTAASESGTAYVYEKTIRLVSGQPSLVLEHSFHNAGSHRIDVRHYNHNFLTMDQQPSGPGFEIRLPFEVRATGVLSPFHLSGNRMTFDRVLGEEESALVELRGYSEKVSDYDITVSHQMTGAAVRIRGDRPLVKLLFWAKRRVLCPEPYIHINVAPGDRFTWRIAYDFHEL